MYGHDFKQSMDQPGKVANSAINSGQLVRPASACSFSTIRVNLVLTRGIPPDLRGGVHLFI